MKTKYVLVVLKDNQALCSAVSDEETMLEESAQWVAQFPECIPMLVETLIDFCKHCKNPIMEKPGWVLHRWIHTRTGAHICWNAVLTQAQPMPPPKHVFEPHGAHPFCYYEFCGNPQSDPIHVKEK